MTEQDDKCSLCGEQMLSLACPGGCFTATAHEVDGLVCKDRQRTREVRKARAEAKLVAPTAVPLAFDTDLREYVRVVTREDVGSLCINVSDGRRLLDEIKLLRLERDEVRAACAVLRGYIAGPVVYVTDAEIAARRAQRDKLLATPNSGQGVLVELDRLRRLEAALEDNSLMRLFYKDSGSADVTGLVLCSYRDALRKRAKGE